MPRILVTAIPADMLREALPALLDELQTILECPRQDFQVEVSRALSLVDDPFPFVEVAWFDRGQALQDQVASALTRHLLAAGCPTLDVVFRRLEPSAYYEDGAHF